MSASDSDNPYSDSHLDSPEYRKRLMRKLNTLIAVLEVACAKVRRSLDGPEADTDRLTRIQKNLKDTLKVCQRAKKALQNCEALPEGLPSSLMQGAAECKQTEVPRPPRGVEVELTSREERERFESLGPIQADEVRAVDMDELCGKFWEE